MSSSGPASILDGKRPYTIPPSTLGYFRSHPWTSSFLSSSLYTPIETSSRVPKTSGEDGMLAVTLATQSTIPHLVTFQSTSSFHGNQDPLPEKPPYAFPPPAVGPGANIPLPDSIPDMTMLVGFGESGICGHPATAHGGLLCMLLDEIMSIATIPYATSPLSPETPFGAALSNESTERGGLYTAQLDVRYRRPVSVPGPVIVKGWCVAKERRKTWVRGVVIQEVSSHEERNGRIERVNKEAICAEGFSLFIQSRGSTKL